jgi:hypothetical protein
MSSFVMFHVLSFGYDLICFSQVPKNHEEDFKSIKKFSVFNTNNLWISLSGENDCEFVVLSAGLTN